MSVFTGLAIAGVGSWAYGLVFLLPRSMGFGFRGLAVLEFVTGSLCLLTAAAVGRTWLASAARQEVAAIVCIAALLSTLSWSMHVGELSPEQMTAESIVFMVVGSAIIRSSMSMFLFWGIATLNWLLTQYLDPKGTFVTRSWALTWVVASGGAIAVYAMASTQRRLAEALRISAEALAERDLLTGLPNRRGFLRQASRLVAMAKRDRRSLWLGFIDVDRFKSINDQQGHEAGDLVLSAVGTALPAACRSGDLTARWGGDEFVVLGIGEPPKAHDIETRICDALSDLPTAIRRAWVPGVTFGSSQVRPFDSEVVGDVIPELVAASDEQMYARRRAKGRVAR